MEIVYVPSWTITGACMIAVVDLKQLKCLINIILKINYLFLL